MVQILPTEEQVDICSHVVSSSNNIIINAFAGTGKSATLRMINNVFAVEPALYVVFNKDAKEKAEKEFPSTTMVKTFNGIGHSIWMRNFAKPLKPDSKKMAILLSEKIRELKGEDRQEVSKAYSDILEACGRAKNAGYIPNGKFSPAHSLICRDRFYASLDFKISEFLQEIIDSLLCQSIKGAFAGGIDFDDQIYMPTLFGGTFPRFPRVMVDEWQDVNPVNFEMCKKLGKSWLAAVGDPNQSIYAFRGALQKAMGEATSYFKAETFDLSVSFRCPQAVVEAARWRVPNFKWKKAGGVYERLKELTYEEIPDGVAIICRNNAPLFKQAFNLIKAGRSVKVAGSEIGPRIVGMLKKLGEGNLSREQALSAISRWEEVRLEEAKSEATVRDTAECMRVFVSHNGVRTLSHAITYAEHILKQEGSIQLITGHKAKGKEWNTVYFLDPWIIGNDEQELNLRYVIQTRAKESCFEIDSRDIHC